VGNGLRRRPAMLARQVARLRDLPDGQKRRFVKVEPAASGTIVHRLHKTSIESRPVGMRLLRLGLSAWPAIQNRTSHDSVLEEQQLRASGCDWDHF
jgi:hypothetical protein